MTALREDMAEYSAEPMDEQEARQYCEWVRSALEDARTYLLELYEGRGWEVLGYPTFEAMCAAEFGCAKSQAYDRVKAARVQLLVSGQPVSGMPENPVITTRAGVALHEVLDDEGEQAMVDAYTGLAASGPVTEQRVKDSRPPKPLTRREQVKEEREQSIREEREKHKHDPYYVQEDVEAACRAFLSKAAMKHDAALAADALSPQSWASVQVWFRTMRDWMADVEAARAKGAE